MGKSTVVGRSVDRSEGEQTCRAGIATQRLAGGPCRDREARHSCAVDGRAGDAAHHDDDPRAHSAGGGRVVSVQLTGTATSLGRPNSLPAGQLAGCSIEEPPVDASQQRAWPNSTVHRPRRRTPMPGAGCATGWPRRSQRVPHPPGLTALVEPERRVPVGHQRVVHHQPTSRTRVPQTDLRATSGASLVPEAVA